MTRRVYKYPFGAAAECALVLPAGAEVLRIDVQAGAIFAWALVDVDVEPEPGGRVVIVGTGHDVPDGELRFINTFLVDSGRFVFHAFEVA